MRLSAAGNYEYGSRRSIVMTPNAAVATSQPLATQAGISALRAGGSAADAAVAVAAALQVTKPCVTGLGGDAFFLYYERNTNSVHAYNGSGRSPAALTREAALAVAEDGELPDFHPYTVTVPGAADTWVALNRKFGCLELGTILEPAIRLAADGFPVPPMTSVWWSAGAQKQLALTENGYELTIDGRGPAPGERFSNPGLAGVLESLAADGRDVFYSGWVARKITEAVQRAGGLLGEEDLASHAGEWVRPISLAYGDHIIHECPPNGQGLAALIALGIFRELAPPDELRVHAQVESMRMGFADAARHIADPLHSDIPVERLLDDGYLRSRAAEVSLDRRAASVSPGFTGPGNPGSDTVYFSVVDSQGNGCSFINSNFMGFGTGIVPAGCGFSLQNRGRGFVLDPDHPNVVAPKKRPYHTIIPGLITNAGTGHLGAVFGIMGGMMQPQAHLQVASAMIDHGVDPQSALDAPRFQLALGEPDGEVLVEDSMAPRTIRSLEERGHVVSLVSGADRSLFGLGQVIAVVDGNLWSGSDPRGDGTAAGF